VIGRAVLEFVPAEDRETAQQRLTLREGGTYESVGLRKDGKKILLEVAAREYDASGQPARLTALRDVTEQRSLELQFRQAQKMEAVGRLAGGVAHDFNNILTVISGNAELLLDAMMASDPRREEVDQIRKAADSATVLTRQLLAFGRQQVIEPRLVVLGEALTATKRMLDRLIGEDIDLELRLTTARCDAHIDPGQLEQMILNLVVNARDAMPTGGKLTIGLEATTVDEDHARQYWPATPGAYAVISVSDTGEGMDVATRERIFEPFFTTKEVGKGTGLGLASVYGAVKQSGGFIAVYSEPSIGTTFRIYLPLVDPNSSASTVPPDHRPAPTGHEMILLVEDSNGVRDVARRALRAQGYTVVDTAGPMDALIVARRPGQRFDLLLTDVVMPQMSGRVLAERFKELHPNARVLYMSGYTDDAIVRHGVLTADMPYLQKPFSTHQLAARVREVLDA
jgi:two-component system cell cycle sensor histidine kinase/response regulator CckA